MTKYVRLTCVERAQIESLHRLGHLPIEIAVQIGSHQSTISRELARLAPGGYVARPAQEHADQRRHIPTLVPLLDRCPTLVRHLRHCMKQRYSIAQALMLIARKYPDLPTITATAAYNWLFSWSTVLKRELKRLLIRPPSTTTQQEENRYRPGENREHAPHKRAPDRSRGPE